MTYCTPAVPLAVTHASNAHGNSGYKDYYIVVKKMSYTRIYLEKFMGLKRKTSRESFRHVVS